MKKAISFLFFVLLGAFAALQLNDPDGPAWFLIYGGVAIICLLAGLNVYRKSIVLGSIIGLAVFDLFLLRHFVTYLGSNDKSEIVGEMVYEKPYIEGTREFLGVLIAIICLGVILRLFSTTSQK